MRHALSLLCAFVLLLPGAGAACSFDSAQGVPGAGMVKAPGAPLTEEQARARVAALKEVIDNPGHGDSNPCARQERIDEMDALIEQHPKMPEALVLRARMHMINPEQPNPDFVNAKYWVDLAISHDPDYDDSYVLMGHILANMGMFDEAREMLDKAEALGSKSPWVRLNRASIERLSGNRGEAEKIYMEVAQDPSTPIREKTFALSMVADYAGLREDWATAERLIDQAVAERPDNINSAWMLGNLAVKLAHARRYDQAVMAARKALAIMSYGNGERVLAASLYFVAIEDFSAHGKLTPKGKAAFEEARGMVPTEEEALDLLANYRADTMVANHVAAMFREVADAGAEAQAPKGTADE